jgi:hypothetical protein
MFRSLPGVYAVETLTRNAGKTLLLLCRTLYGDVSETTCEQNTKQQPSDDSMSLLLRLITIPVINFKVTVVTQHNHNTFYTLRNILVFHVFNIANVAF